MWLVASFDLPVGIPSQVREAARFRKRLLAEGFSMLQKSVYLRWEATNASAEATTRRLFSLCPHEGDLVVLRLPEANMRASGFLHDGSPASPPEPPPAFLIV